MMIMDRLVVTAAFMVLSSIAIDAREANGTMPEGPVCSKPASAPLAVPDDWWSWGEEDIREHLKCEAITQAGRPIPTNETWVFLRRTYRNIVSSDDSTISSRDDVDGFDGVPIEAAMSPGKGRGLFATTDIPKGTRIWTSRRQCACFHDAHSVRRFLAALPTDLACDVLQWAYVEHFGKKQGELFCCDLDEGSLMNTKGEKERANVGCLKEVAKQYKGGCDDNYFALRTIRSGEEILCDYDLFDVPNGWTRFGL